MVKPLRPPTPTPPSHQSAPSKGEVASPMKGQEVIGLSAALTPQNILQLQKSVGNRAVLRLLKHTMPPPATLPSETPPIQGVFIYRGSKLLPKPVGANKANQPPIIEEVWGWQDSDTGAAYMWRPGMKRAVTQGPNEIPAFVMVMRTDGFSVMIRPTRNPSEWEVIGEDEESQAIRLKPGSYEKIKRVPRPTFTYKDTYEIEMEQEPATPVAAPDTTGGNSSIGGSGGTTTLNSTMAAHSSTGGNSSMGVGSSMVVDNSMGGNVTTTNSPTVNGTNAAANPANSFVKGTHTRPDYFAASEQELKDKQFRNSRLDHNLTAQLEVLPIAQGVPVTIFGEANTIRDYKYTANQVRVGTVLMGDQDRTKVGTYLEPKSGSNTPQGRHAVAWALVRRSIMGLRGLTVEQVMDHFKSSLALIVPLTKSSPEAAFNISRINYPTGLEALAAATLAIDVWQKNLGEIVAVYAQLYHLSEGALFEGSSKQRGEAPAAKAFGESESLLVQGKDMRHSVAVLAKHAENFIDLDLDLNHMTVQSLAFAVHHWVDTLDLTYPHVMKAHGKAITDPLLNRTITHPQIPQTIKTLGALVVYKGYKLPTFATIVVPTLVTGESKLNPFVMKDLDADFVASVSIVPIQEGQDMLYSVKEAGGTTHQMNLRGFMVGDLMIRTMALSDNDRPRTKMKKGQGSHTTAWTLVRHDLFAYASGPVALFLEFLKRSFTQLSKESALAEGETLALHAIKELTAYDTKRWALHDWQSYVSMLVKWYAHVYQQAKSTSFKDDNTQGQALGHAEPFHMALLRRNDNALFNEGSLVDDSHKVAESAVKLFDLSVSKTNDSEAREDMYMKGYDHWKMALQHTFPYVYAAGWGEIYDLLADKDIGWVQNLPNWISPDLYEMGMGRSNPLRVILERTGRNK